MTEKTNAPDLEVMKKTLYDRMKLSGWGDKLKTFLLSDDFTILLLKLYEQSIKGEKFTPPLKQVFRAFIECPYNKTKVILVGQDPYPALNQADGISFSCSNGKVAVSLRYIFEEIERTVYPDQPDCATTFDPDLARWAQQGVLMLNTALTTSVGKIGAHYDLWRPFTIFLLDVLRERKDIVYIMVGKKALEWTTYLDKTVTVHACSHPAYAAYGRNKKWDSGDVFNLINRCLREKGKEPIIW